MTAKESAGVQVVNIAACSGHKPPFPLIYCPLIMISPTIWVDIGMSKQVVQETRVWLQSPVERLTSRALS